MKKFFVLSVPTLVGLFAVTAIAVAGLKFSDGMTPSSITAAEGCDCGACDAGCDCCGDDVCVCQVCECLCCESAAGISTGTAAAVSLASEEASVSTCEKGCCSKSATKGASSIEMALIATAASTKTAEKGSSCACDCGDCEAGCDCCGEGDCVCPVCQCSCGVE